MTRSRQAGHNEVTDEAKREAARTGEDVRVIVDRMLRLAKQTRDRAGKIKIVRAQKFLRFRNQAKRKKRK